jgi:hypothetical protein
MTGALPLARTTVAVARLLDGSLAGSQDGNAEALMAVSFLSSLSGRPSPCRGTFKRRTGDIGCSTSLAARYR